MRLIGLVLALTLALAPFAVNAGQATTKDPLPATARMWCDVVLDSVSRRVGLTPLRDVALPQQDLELRIWWQYSDRLTQGYVVRQTAGSWSGLQIEFEEPLRVDGVDWRGVWTRLLQAGLLQIKDVDIGRRNLGLDGPYTVYIVEIRHAGSYQRHHVWDLPSSPPEDVRRVLAVVQVLRDSVVSARLPRTKN